METPPLHRFAVVADAHFHDPHADFGVEGFAEGGRRLALRLPGDVARAPRIYNEAGAILNHVLTRLAAEGIRDVVLLGDYSDDGQAVTMAALAACLDAFREREGMRFFAVPGNHDIYGDHGRHRRKRYAGPEGESVLVTSDPGFLDPKTARRVVSPVMHCDGYPEGLLPMAGFLADPAGLHWETPFGTDPDPASRTYGLHDATGQEVRRLMDASYLVEPVAGVWFVMIDANVFAPDPDGEDGLADSTAAGWNALLVHKPFMLPWLRSIAERARRLGKQVIHFSHYPVLETLNGTLDLEREMMGPNAFHRRMPDPGVGEALLAAGMRLHFSGHVHVNDTARLARHGDALVNIAVPALVAYPAAVKLVTVDRGRALVDTLSISDMPLDPDLLRASRRLQALTGADTGDMLVTDRLGDFLNAHLAHITGRRFVKREWPEDLAPVFRGLGLPELLALAGYGKAVPEAARPLSAMDLLADWYRLRAGGDLAARDIPAPRLAAYREIVAQPLDPRGNRRLGLLLASLRQHLSGLPSVRLTVDLGPGGPAT